MAYRLIAYIFILSLSHDAFSAACCGGGAGLPNIITGDYKTQIGFSYSNSAVIGTADGDQEVVERSGENREVKEVVNFKMAHLLSDYWQVGLELPYLQNTHSTIDSSESYASAGDPIIQVTYEFLPELTYSKWKPRGFAFLSYSYSNTASIYESDSVLGTDALGTGFDTIYIGTSFTKIRRQLDISIYFKQGFRQRKKFSDENSQVEVKPGTIQSAGIGLGYSPKQGQWRFGPIINSFYEGAKEINTSNNSQSSSSKSYVDFGLNATYHTGLASYGVSFVDQSFWGKGSNINLSKTFSLSCTSFFEL